MSKYPTKARPKTSGTMANYKCTYIPFSPDKNQGIYQKIRNLCIFSEEKTSKNHKTKRRIRTVRTTANNKQVKN